MNHEELTELINLIAKTELEVIRSPSFVPIKRYDASLGDMGIGSLEYMMLYLHIGEILNIPNEKFQIPEMVGEITLGLFLAFIDKYATNNPSLSEAKAEYLDDR